MSENNGHKTPRHLDDITAMMPAIPRAPKHAADDPDRRGTPYLDSPTPQPDGVAPPPTEAPRVTRKQARDLPWYKRWFGLTR